MGNFFKESWVEISQRVSWPSYKELQANTTLVLVGSLVFAIFVGIIDLAFENALNLFYQSF